VIGITDNRLRIQLTSDAEVGIDIGSLRVAISGEIFNGTTWSVPYASSYIQPQDDGSYTLVIVRSSNWLPGTRYFVLCYLVDNNGVGDV